MREDDSNPIKRLGNKHPGRPKGTRNKATTTAKDNILAVFTRMGGTAGMADWARENPTEFYRLYGKLIPTNAHVDVTGTVTLERLIESAIIQPESDAAESSRTSH